MNEKVEKCVHYTANIKRNKKSISPLAY